MHPAVAAKLVPQGSASASVAQRVDAFPLCMIARVKSPALPGDTRCRLTLFRAGRLSGNRHVGRIATEGGDVISDPDQRGALIEEPIIAR